MRYSHRCRFDLVQRGRGLDLAGGNPSWGFFLGRRPEDTSAAYIGLRRPWSLELLVLALLRHVLHDPRATPSDQQSAQEEAAAP